MHAHTILPPNASALMRAVDRAVPDWETLPAALRGTRYGHPRGLDPWLAAEWALSPFARYFPDTDALFAAGLPWLIERGTAAAVKRALGWVGFGNARLDEDGPWLHIDLGRAATNQELARIAHVVRASVPAHVLFYRVYWAWDLRPVWLDARPMLDAGVLDNESGVNIPLPGQDPIKASFGRLHASITRRPYTAPVRTRLQACVRQRALRLDVPRLDTWRLDSAIVTDAIQAAVTHHPSMAPAHPRRSPPGRVVPTLRHLAPPRAAPAPASLLHAEILSTVPRAIPLPRGWAGTWDSGTWAATPFPTRVTTETV